MDNFFIGERIIGWIGSCPVIQSFYYNYDENRIEIVTTKDYPEWENGID